MDILSGEATLSKLFASLLRSSQLSKERIRCPCEQMLLFLKEIFFQNGLGLYRSNEEVTKVDFLVRDSGKSTKYTCIKSP